MQLRGEGPGGSKVRAGLGMGGSLCECVRVRGGESLSREQPPGVPNSRSTKAQCRGHVGTGGSSQPHPESWLCPADVLPKSKSWSFVKQGQSVA